MLFMPGSDSKQGAVNNFAKVFDQVLSESNKQNGDKLLIEKVIIMDGDKYKLDNLNKLNIPEYLLSDLIANDGIIEQNVLDEVTSDDPAIIMFTSGTTGKPKGAYLTHFTLGNNALIVANSYDLDHDEKSLCLPLPFFHTFGLLGNLGMCATPYKLVIPNCKYNVKQMVESMARNECSYLYGTPTMIIDTVNYLESNKLKLPSLRGLIAGGSPMPKEVAYRVQKVIPSCTDVRVAWGATEAGCSGSLSRQSDSLYNRIETVGRPIDHMETKIVNQATRQITKIGEPGEIESRGHNQMIGYWRNPKSTHDAIDASGCDLAVMTEEGFIKIIGRTKEMIIRGGENIYPREVEELLHSHPAIRDAYVCGVPDDRMGEELCAWIQVKDAAVKPTESEVKEFCKQKIAHFKVPRYVLFVDSFPLTPAGKVKKFVMREESCGAVKQAASNIAVALLDRGINQSSLIAFYGPNSIQHAVLRVAVQLLGVTFMPLSPTFGEYEVTEEVRAVGADIVMCSARDLDKFNSLLDSNNNDEIRLVVVFDGKHDEHMTYDRLREEGQGLGAKLAKVPHFDVQSRDETLFLIHTSGTTGAPKCAQVPHRMILNNVRMYNSTRASMVSSFLYPLGHMSGTFGLPMQLCTGGTMIMFPDYDDEFIAQSVEKYLINSLGIFPNICKQLVDHGLLDKYDMSSLKMLFSGGAAFPSDIARVFIDKYGLIFGEAYGMTECCPVTSPNIGATQYEPGNCGHITPGIELKVIDLTTGESLGPNHDGEICIRGANLITGYRNNTKAWTEAMDGEGWYRTGDIGHYDDRECIFITDRLKEVVRIGVGQHYINISPVEIEQYLLTHPSIAEVAVVGVNNKAGTHRPRAYVVLKIEHIVTSAEIEKFVSDTLAYTKQLTGGVVFVDQIVRTILGNEPMCPDPAEMRVCYNTAKNDWGISETVGHSKQKWCCFQWQAYECQMDLGVTCTGVDKQAFDTSQRAIHLKLQDDCAKYDASTCAV
ncbi:unnamed protein product [Medioppia subpectinata]|uniref:Medium-chain acyl-CoA ligase ACSF2, mitochondrial n=1 Tax=Medioppia subpectinata TaxID=1979941 RepID=A0A7R9PVQ4_9ACAR|nr:unnamed protein product [Medioppia subpectinata]CAG2102903.1 unnamed protein product [Medioppia subpectinata]